MGYQLTGDQHKEFSRKLAEIGRQVGQKEYPFDPNHALKALQDVVEGKFRVGGEIIEHELEYGPDVIKRLTDEGGPWGYCNSNINDENYPVRGEGIVKVRFELVSGEELKRDNGCVYRFDVEAEFARRGLRLPNAAEALLPVAKDKQLGRGNHPLVAFIGGSRAAFFGSRVLP